MSWRTWPLALVALVSLAGCGRSEFEDRTAVVSIDGTSQTYQVDSCGLDDVTVFLVARSPDGDLLQMVVGLDESDIAVASQSGVSVDTDPSDASSRVAAFGAEAWDRRGLAGPPPGAVTSAALIGSRIQIGADAVPVGSDDQPVVSSGVVPLAVDARCDGGVPNDS